MEGDRSIILILVGFIAVHRQRAIHRARRAGGGRISQNPGLVNLPAQSQGQAGSQDYST